jgi:hypothetical protein
MRRLEAEELEVPDNELKELVLRDVGLEIIPKLPISVQEYYMRRGSYMDLNTSVQQYVERLNDLNRYLLCFPEEDPKQLVQNVQLLSYIEFLLWKRLDAKEQDMQILVSLPCLISNLLKFEWHACEQQTGYFANCRV